MIVVFSDHTHLLLKTMPMKIVESIALFGTLTNIHRSNRYETCNKNLNNMLVFLGKLQSP